MLVASCTSGLCNRIHAVLGSKIMAEKLGREFSVYWPRNGELDLSFQAIFESNIKLMSKKDLMRRLAYPGCTIKVYNANTTGPREYENISYDDTEETILIKPWTSPLFRGQVYDMGHNKAMSEVLKTLPFRKSIRDKANPEKYKKFVGVHIRYGDYRPNGINHTEYFSKSSVDAFCASMESIRSSYPDVCFYVSCPNIEIKRNLASRFSVEYLEVDPTRSPQGIKDAIVDLINLSGCAFCLGSHNSQFSQFVCLMSDKKVGIVSDAPYLAYGTAHTASSHEEFVKYFCEYSNTVMPNQ